MNNNIFQHNSSCVLGVTFSLTLEKAMVGDLGESLCLKKYWFCSLRKETLVSYYIKPDRLTYYHKEYKEYNPPQKKQNRNEGKLLKIV